MSNTLSLMLVDDHALVRETLRVSLSAEPGIEVTSVASDADQAVREAGRLHPDIILMDIDMPDLLCFDAARMIRDASPLTRIIFLSDFLNDRYIERALAVEAAGYVTKSEPPESLIKAIRSAAAGGVYFSPDVQARLVVDGEGTKLSHNWRSRASTLTRREIEVLRYIARGLSKKQIAKTMHLGVKTVEHHSTSVMSKLDIHDRVGLARYAIREGLAEA
ncbi:MAG: response regulator transcription factor [Planctomycetes bacterium]|nr:response regulator transcription factor [Planctomycetota bacterium]